MRETPDSMGLWGLLQAKASISGRVKEAAAKGLLSKPKKEKSPEEECLADMKKLQKKSFDVH